MADTILTPEAAAQRRLHLIERARILQLDAGQLENEALRLAGWTYTSTHPACACYWKWVKRIGDHDLVTDKDHAMNLMRHDDSLYDTTENDGG